MPVFIRKNDKFFENWTREMAYVLGFFIADGSITVNPRGSEYFSIQITDKKLLEKIRRAMNSDHKITKKKVKINEGPLYRLQIGSKKMCNDLRNLGLIERKARRIQLPDIPKNRFGDFLRGYFDGDGSVWINYMNRRRKTPTFVIQTTFTSCSNNFLKALQEKLKKFNLRGGALFTTQENTFRLQYSVKDSLLLYQLMYDNLDNDLFLKRKREIFEKYKKIRTDTCGRSSAG